MSTKDVAAVAGAGGVDVDTQPRDYNELMD